MKIIISDYKREANKLKKKENEEHMIPVYKKQDVLHNSSIIQINYRIKNGNRSMFLSAIPVPRATALNGSSAI